MTDRTIRLHRVLRASPQKVYRAFTEARAMAKWLPPYGFTNCQRGAWGTRVAPHAKGAKVHHLKECFGLFVPDGDTRTLAEYTDVEKNAISHRGNAFRALEPDVRTIALAREADAVLK